jgi:hypothetical protein
VQGRSRNCDIDVFSLPVTAEREEAGTANKNEAAPKIFGDESHSSVNGFKDGSFLARTDDRSHLVLAMGSISTVGIGSIDLSAGIR